MKWKVPPVIKVYEALGALGDERLEITENEARVYSSSGNKFYTVMYDPTKKAITTNDNGSYWQKYLGYPAISFLLAKDVIRHDQKWYQALKGFHWKNINTSFKNDFALTEAHIREEVAKRGFDLAELDKQLQSILEQIGQLNLSQLGKTAKPPTGY